VATEVRQFEEFVAEVSPRLLRAFVGVRGAEASEAVAEALAYAWEHRDALLEMENPAGYLYRVGVSRTRPGRRPQLPGPTQVGVPDVDPRLIPALLALPITQRTAVWLVHACGWSYADVAIALDTTTSMVGNHIARGMDRLRRRLKVDVDDGS
jgi:DNA-directed RNA polymerase specialized sigma24 family protein